MRTTFTRTRIRFLADAALGLGIFCALTALTLGPSAATGLLGIEGVLKEGASTLAQTGGYSHLVSTPSNGFVALAIMFSTLFALNFAFLRHLHRASQALEAVHNSK